MTPASLDSAAQKLQGARLRTTLGRLYVLAYLGQRPGVALDTVAVMHGLAELGAPVKSGSIPMCLRDLVRCGLVRRSLSGVDRRIAYAAG